METTLKQNSFFPRLWKWFYQTEELPKSLCKYFWSVILATLLAIPAFVIYEPARLFSYLIFSISYERTGGYWKYKTDEDMWGDRLGKSFLFWSFIGLTILFIRGIYLGFLGLYGTNFGIAMGILALFIVVGVIFLVDKLFSTAPMKRTTTATKEAVKGFLNNYCPRITWK